MLTLRRGETIQQITLSRKLLDDGRKLERLGIAVRSLTETRHMGLAQAVWNAPLYNIKSIVGAFATTWLNWSFGKRFGGTDIVEHTKFSYLGLLGFLAFSLGLFNMLPMPVLVGGEALYVVAQLILRRPLEEVTLERVRVAGFVIFLLLMGSVIVMDVYSYVSRSDSNSYAPRSKNALSVIQWSQYNLPLSA